MSRVTNGAGNIGRTVGTVDEASGSTYGAFRICVRSAFRSEYLPELRYALRKVDLASLEPLVYGPYLFAIPKRKHQRRELLNLGNRPFAHVARVSEPHLRGRRVCGQNV